MAQDDSYILLVDDEPNNLFLLEELLLAEGYVTQSVMSGQEALTMAEGRSPDLILLDIMMPDMDGFEVCERLRQNPNLATVPIIFLTALDDEESRLEGFDRMADDYLTKPIRSGLLLSKIRNLLRLTKLRRQKAENQSQQELQNAWQEKKNLAEKFRLFVPDQFLRRIAPQGVDSIQVGNVREEEVTILFCDIRAFTAIAEGQDPKSTFAWLNAFFDQMNEAISLHHGFIDKFLGDAIMAVFDREQEHPADAIAAALQMEKNLKLFNQELDDYTLENPLRMGIGIHTGTAVIGTIGASSRMDSTVIGDVVNTASRLEELTKTYNCNIIASGQTRTRLREEIGVIWQKLDVIQPRGKQQAIDIYQVMAMSQ